jgi:hypothetical protein
VKDIFTQEMRGEGSEEDYMTRSFMLCIPHQISFGENGGAYRVLVGKPEGRRPFGRSMYRWECNIKVDLREVGWGQGLD